MKRHLLSISCGLMLATGVHAEIMPEFGLPIPKSPDFTENLIADYDFEGIVALSNCSGSLVRFDDSQDTDKALVLSNGHCTGMIDPGKVVLNQNNSRSFNVLGSQANKVGTVRAEKLLYATMTKTDMSLYQVKETYEDIRTQFNVEALTLSREAPALGHEIEVISGYWRRGYSCAVAAIADTLKEGKWSFQEAIRYTASCNTIGGTSGAPVVATGTRTVVAVNNTGNTSGRKCEVNNPCEVSKDGTIIYQKGYSYAQQTWWLYSCRNDQGQLDLSVAGCQLPR
ncbi:S1 family peptidase [Oligoflexus tunisiensis]|uniref:S1 family peptidase n=1 Tax=Oligoflexus tunisiensis TaxID=708132 RepID=UPI00114CAFDA|nr:serine protease [Oligoflexus tunisiensis]